MRIRDRVPKVRGGGAHRECTEEDTYERMRPWFGQLGITRIADVTGMDRLGIPVYSAMVPRSNDAICAYHGKGSTPTGAKVSAVMEAAERFSGGLPLRPVVVASYHELVAEGRTVLRPSELNLALLPGYGDDRPIYWLAGHDLVDDEEVLVPHGAVSYVDAMGAPPCYALTTSNGLASGNSIEEAICHALTELIERDALTIAEVVGDRLGRILGGAAPGAEYPRLDLDTLPPEVRSLVARFDDAGIELRLVVITSDVAIPAIMAVASHGADDPRGYRGFGAHPDVEVALVRAITECAQVRALADPSTVDGSGMLPPSGDKVISTAELSSHPGDDIVADIGIMLDRLRARGLNRAIVVDVSPPGIPVHVVRVLVPGLESWSIDRSRLGARATEAWNDAVQLVLDRQR